MRGIMYDALCARTREDVDLPAGAITSEATHEADITASGASRALCHARGQPEKEGDG